VKKIQRPCNNDVMTGGPDYQPTTIKQGVSDATSAVRETHVSPETELGENQVL
jgi:hypothetical protein